MRSKKWKQKTRNHHLLKTLHTSFFRISTLPPKSKLKSYGMNTLTQIDLRGIPRSSHVRSTRLNNRKCMSIWFFQVAEKFFTSLRAFFSVLSGVVIITHDECEPNTICIGADYPCQYFYR